MLDIDALYDEARKLRAGKKRGAYPSGFKKKIVAALEVVDEKELATLLGLKPSTFHTWRRRYGTKLRTRKVKPAGQSFVELKPQELEATITPPKGPSNSAPSRSPANADSQVHLEFTDGRGHRLHVNIPWHPEMAGSLLAFVGDALEKGGMSWSR